MEWQIRSTFASGCAGIFVFSWTDEWHRGGFDIEDWGFGLTDRNRNPKASLAGIGKAFAEVPFPADLNWPAISVVVCTYNGKRTIRDCLEGLRRVDYPNFEVIVVNDGSTDGTQTIAKEYGFRVISIPNGGLSNARNVGMRASKARLSHTSTMTPFLIRSGSHTLPQLFCPRLTPGLEARTYRP